MKDLKDYRENELKYYAIANVVIIILSTGLYSDILGFVSGKVSGMSETILDFVVKVLGELIGAGIAASIAYVYVFVLDSIIPGKMKNKICYLFFGKKPGHTIFTSIKNERVKDERFPKDDVVSKYSEVYKKLETAGNKDKEIIENKAWYEIYRKYKKDGMVFHANRDYLLCRDLCIMTLSLAVLYAVACAVLSIAISWKLLVFLLVEFIAIDLAFWARGRTLVYNVIAKDMYNKEDVQTEE